MGYCYGDSKTALKPRCDSCSILQLWGGAQVVFSKFAGVCCKLLLPQPLQNATALLEHVSGTYCICKHQFFGYLRFLCTTFSWEYALQYATENFLVNSSYLFHRPISIFKPLWTPVQAINKTWCVWNRIRQLREMRSWHVLMYKRVARWRGWGGKGGATAATQGSPDLQESTAKQIPQYA